jgi:glycosyl transferase family 1/glycosyl transferase family 4
VRDEALERRVRPDTEVIRVTGGSALAMWLKLGRGGGGRRSGRTFGRLRRMSDWWLLPDSYAGWARRARAAVARRIARGGVDAVLTSSPPDSAHLAAPRAPGARGDDAARDVPWIADFRDPWVALHLRTPPTRWHAARHAALERAVLAGADLVLAASRTDCERIAASGIPVRALRHLPNGYEPEPAGAAAPDPAYCTFVFTGTLALMPDTELFLDALHDVLAHDAAARRVVRVRFIGPFEQGYADRAEALGLTGIVRFEGPRAHEVTRATQAAADVLLLWKPRAMPTMVPGKLYEYLDAGRPVLAVLDPADEAATLVRDAGGETVPPGDRAALAGALRARLARWRAGGLAAPPRPAWLAHHTRATLAGELARALDGLVAARAGGARA